MTVNELTNILKTLPPEAEVTINYVYPVDTGETITCSVDVEDAVFDKYSQTLDLMTKEYKENE